MVAAKKQKTFTNTLPFDASVKASVGMGFQGMPRRTGFLIDSGGAGAQAALGLVAPAVRI